uniref:Uncharacterized protein n=1 Tax=Rhizophora mucronata TaxID=61149 RepID=A0A2P2Q5N0_RHIMU
MLNTLALVVLLKQEDPTMYIFQL